MQFIMSGKENAMNMIYVLFMRCPTFDTWYIFRGFFRLNICKIVHTHVTFLLISQIKMTYLMEIQYLICPSVY